MDVPEKYQPKLQLLHADKAVVSAKRPGLQSVQLSEAYALANFPAEHAKHVPADVAPIAVLAYPGMHEMHADEPVNP